MLNIFPQYSSLNLERPTLTNFDDFFNCILYSMFGNNMENPMPRGEKLEMLSQNTQNVPYER